MTTKSPMQKLTLKDFQKMFPDDDACLDYLRHELYPEIIECEGCGKNARYYRISTRKVYSCEHCGFQISPTADTIFHKSPTPLTIWFYAVYLMAQTRGGISAKQIERETGVTYKTAWRMCGQIRSMLYDDGTALSGDVETDESYFGGKATSGSAGAVLRTRLQYSAWRNAGARSRPLSWLMLRARPLPRCSFLSFPAWRLRHAAADFL